MEQVTTAHILLDKHLNRSCGQECVDWATTMFMQGHQGKNLAALSTMSPPFNQFEMTKLRDHALEEVSAPDLSMWEAAQIHIAEQLQRALDGEVDLIEVVDEADGLAMDFFNDYPNSNLFTFSLLHWAYLELRSEPRSDYWQAATPETIIEIMREEARKFITTIPHPDRPNS